MKFCQRRSIETSKILLFLSLCSLGLACAFGQNPDGRVAAFGRVSAGERTLTVAVPYYLGAPQVVSELSVKEGDHVSRNQKLASTNNRALAAADVADAKARWQVSVERLNGVNAGPKNEDVAAQEALVKSLQADARSEKAPGFDKKDSLNWKVTMSQDQLAALRTIRPTDISVAQAEVAETEAAVKRSEVLLESTEVLSPMDGQVLKILTYPGEAGAQGLLELGDTQSMTIAAELNVADASRAKPGARATIKSAAWSGEVLGKVTKIRPLVERSQLSAQSTFSNVDRVVVEAMITPDEPSKLAGLTGAEVTVLISVDPAAK